MRRYYIIKMASGSYYAGLVGNEHTFTERARDAYRYRLKWKAMREAWEGFTYYDGEHTVEMLKVDE